MPLTSNTARLNDHRIGKLGTQLEVKILLKNHSTPQHFGGLTTKPSDRVVCYEMNASECKHIIDEIDVVLAQHYGFTPEELDFIINYDIKYRLGRGAGDEDE